MSPTTRLFTAPEEQNMVHELRPRSGCLPPASEVARLLATEFALVKPDANDALSQARARAEWIERAPAHVFLGRYQQALQGAARLKSLGPGDALTIDFGDRPEQTKRIVVIPGEPISVGYASEEDEQASKDLIERCARVLECDLVRV